MDYNNNKNRDEERVFSVIMTEDELSLFSEFLKEQNHPFNTSREKDAKDFTSAVMNKYDEKIRTNNSSRNKIVSRPMTQEDWEEFRRRNKGNSKGDSGKKLIYYNQKDFSMISRLKSDLARANNLKHNYTVTDIRRDKKLHKDSLKSYEDWREGLYNGEYSEGMSADNLKKETDQVNSLINNEVNAISLLERDPKKYFKITSKQRKKNAFRSIIGKPMEDPKYKA